MNILYSGPYSLVSYINSQEEFRVFTVTRSGLELQISWPPDEMNYPTGKQLDSQ